MKKIILIFIVSIYSINNSNAQTTQTDWAKLIINHNLSINNILAKEKPANMNINSFVMKLFNGESQISDKSKSEINKLNEPLKKYGLELANKLNIVYENDSDLITLSLFPPDVTFDADGNLQTTLSGITGDEVLECALAAIGADLLFGVGGLSAKEGVKWSVKAITKAVKVIGTRALGPIGAGIAIGTFGYCMYQAYLD
jgi:hypothetical protein